MVGVAAAMELHNRATKTGLIRRECLSRSINRRCDAPDCVVLQQQIDKRTRDIPLELVPRINNT